ncbi:MAG: ABC transporter substrate-binding protein [Clostridia bacterium]|nr:ABC transporter substrate-binding protein [Clostridia bacterium]
MKKFTKTLAGILAGLTMLSGCGTEQATEGVETVTWYVPMLITGNGKQEVLDKVNDILETKYNLKLDLIGIDSGNYNNKMQVMNAGQEEYDLAFTSHWKNSYSTNVSNGVFYELTEEDLKKYAPKTYESMSDNVWKAVKIDGKIYAVPNWQIQTRAACIYTPKEFLDETGESLENIKTLDDITGYLRKVQAIHPNCNKIKAMWTQLMPYYNMIEIYEEKMPGAIVFNKEGKPEVINQYDTQEFTDYIDLRQDWVAEGLCTDKYLPDSNADKKEIKEEPIWVHVYSPGGDAILSQSRGYEMVFKQFSNAVMSSTGVTAALTGISATSKNPTAALKMIEVINTDAEVHNLLSYGIEGVDYVKTSENQIERKEEKTFRGVDNWMMGTIANTYLLSNQSPTLIEETKAFNDEAMPSPLLGFNANVDNLTLEISNCKTVINEYLEMLDLGLSDDAKLAEFRAKLDEAGVDKIVSELQSQIDEWYAAQ